MVNELKSIQNELLSLRAKSTSLRQKAKEIETEIDNYLESKDQPGLKYKDTAIIREVKTTHRKKKKTEQESDVFDVLEKYNIHNPSQFLKDLSESKKGSPVETKKLKIKKIKKKKEAV